MIRDSVHPPAAIKVPTGSRQALTTEEVLLPLKAGGPRGFMGLPTKVWL